MFIVFVNKIYLSIIFFFFYIFKGDVINYQKARTAEEIRDRSSKLITFLDLAGHKKYLKTTVAGLSGYCPNHVMLVVSSPAVNVSSPTQLDMTKEHMDLALALRLPFCIVVTKTDITLADNTINWLESVLKSIGCRKVNYITCLLSVKNILCL